MVFVGAVILPHGTLPFDNPVSTVAACRERFSRLQPEMKIKFSNIYSGSLAAGELLASTRPDLVVVHSPHGVTVRGALGVYMNEAAAGNAEWNEQWRDYKVSIALDKQKSDTLVSQLKENNIATAELLGFSGLSMPLRWGEVVPLWYAQQSLKKEPKYIMLTQSRLELGALDHQFAVGSVISDFIDSLEPSHRVAVVISGDLSHTYAFNHCDDPLYMPAPGSSLPFTKLANQQAAKEFEDAACSWVTSSGGNGDHWDPALAQQHLERCFKLQPMALSCGIQGFAALHKLLDCQVAKGLALSAKLHCCEAPTYYGMMAASFLSEEL